MSSKNRLQEIFQRQGLALPVYHTKQIGGPAHAPVWVSEVELPSGERIRGDETTSKTAAEQSAADKALLKLRSSKIASGSASPKKVLHIDQTVSVRPTPPEQKSVIRTCLLINGENLPNLAKIASSFLVPGLEILIFIGHHHHHLSERDYGVQKVLVPTTHSNGVDSCMQVYVGTFLQTDKYDRYLIGTRDHFGSALVDLIQSPEMPWTAKTAILVTTEEHIKKHLS